MRALLILTALALATTGCADKKGEALESVNSDGTCTGKFIDDYNSVKNAKDAYKRAKTMDEQMATLNLADQNCQTFLSAHGDNVTCEARARETGIRTTARASELKSDCQILRQKRSEILAAASLRSYPPSAAEMQTDIVSLPEKSIVMKILNIENIRALGQNSHMTMQNGKPYDIMDSSFKYENGLSCMVYANFTLRLGQEFKTMLISDSRKTNRIATIQLMDRFDTLTITCFQRGPRTPITLSDLISAMDGTIRISLRH